MNADDLPRDTAAGSTAPAGEGLALRRSLRRGREGVSGQRCSAQIPSVERRPVERRSKSLAETPSERSRSQRPARSEKGRSEKESETRRSKRRQSTRQAKTKRRSKSRSEGRRQSEPITPEARSPSPMSTKPSISASLRRDSRRESAQPSEVSQGRTRSRATARVHDRAKVHPESYSKFSSHEFSDPAFPFDVNGYCVLHPDVKMAKLKSRGWKVDLEECPKCMERNLKSKVQHQISGDTESMTSDPTQETFDTRNRSRIQRNEQRGPVDPRGSFNSFHSTRSIHSRGQSSVTAYARVRQDERRLRSPDPSRRNEMTDRRRSTHVANHRLSELHNDRHDFDDYSKELGDERRDHSRRREREHMRSKSRGPRSSSVSSQHGNRRPSEGIKAKRTICVNGVPFDKNGYCFVHPHVKLASKKMLGGWKIHMEFCPACTNDVRNYDDGSVGTGVRSVVSDATQVTTSSKVSLHSKKSSVSFKSAGSSRSTSSWTSDQSKKRVADTDNTFMPLDADGFCVHHPDVQLAKMSKRGGWKVLLDFCPECAQDSLLLGGAVGSKADIRSSGKSVSCSDSGTSHSMFVEKMPYIDEDGKLGHYTGNVDIDGRPHGQGKMKYVNGSKFVGLWEEGNKVEGQVTRAKQRSRSSVAIAPSQTASRRRHAKSKFRCVDDTEDHKSHLNSCSDMRQESPRMSRGRKTKDLNRRKCHHTVDQNISHRQSHRSKSRVMYSRADL